MNLWQVTMLLKTGGSHMLKLTYNDETHARRDYGLLKNATSAVELIDDFGNSFMIEPELTGVFGLTNVSEDMDAEMERQIMQARTNIKQNTRMAADPLLRQAMVAAQQQPPQPSTELLGRRRN